MSQAVLIAAVLGLLSTPIVAAPKNRFFDSNGVRIRYIEQGSGEPVVLIHGLTSNIEESWINTGAIQELAKHHRVIALDCRGHGQSGKPHDPKQYGREMALDVVRLMDHLHIPKAHIVGYSYGGALTTQLLAINEERFITATLGGSAPGGPPPPATLLESWAAEIERGSFRSVDLAIWPTDQPKPTEEQIDQFSAERRAGNDVLALAALLRAPSGPTLDKTALASLRIPVLGVAGTADNTLNALDALKPVIPHLEVVAIQGAGHMATFSRPEFVQAISKFIDAHHAAQH